MFGGTRSFRIYGKWIRRFGVVSIVELSCLAVAAVHPVVHKVEYAEGVTTSGSRGTVSLNVTNLNASVDLIVNSPDGTFAASDNNHSVAFSASTTNETGYTLTISGTDDTRQLKNGVSNTIDSIGAATSASTFENGAAATYSNKWGYKPTMYNSAANTDFLRAPTTVAQTLNKTMCANGTTLCPSSADNYTIGIGVRADYTKPYGAYSNTFVLSLVVNVSGVIIQFDDTTGDTSVSDLPSDITVDPSLTSTTLPNTVPTRTNYLFKSWCDGQVSENGTLCTGNEYEPGDTYSVAGLDPGDIVNLHATWYMYMQDLDLEYCTSTPKLAVDKRDNQKYLVQRLPDGRCWMMDNLNLGATDISVDLDISNSNFSSNTITAATFNSWRKTVATAQTATDGVMFHVDGVDSRSDSAYGMLYNYYAATGGNIAAALATGNAYYDICPSGWRLPTGGANGRETNILITATGYNTYALLRTPVAQGGGGFSLPGTFAAALPTAAGTTASSYWTQSAYSSANAWVLHFTTSGVSHTYTAKTQGRSIRCILKPQIENIANLQDFNTLVPSDRASVIKSMESQTDYTVLDNRDSQQYTIAKLRDGRVWMTKDLNLGVSNLGAALAAANTNVSTSVAANTFNGFRKTTSTVANTRTAGNLLPVDGGVLYNYYVASATTIKVDSSAVNTVVDICPAAWRLPTGGTFGEFKKLYDNYGSSAAVRASVSSGGAGFAMNGEFTPTVTTGVGSYWTSTVSGINSMNTMSFDSSNASAIASRDRGTGAAIRCILKTDLGDFTTLQQLKDTTIKQKQEIIDRLTDSKINYTMRDERDDQYYTVAKYADGTLWITQDLNLGYKPLTQNLTSDNTNTSSTVSASTFNGWVKTNASQLTSTYTAGMIYPLRSMGKDLGISQTDYGMLYNYYAASLGTINGATNVDNASSDVCPAGWRLPAGGTNSEYKALYTNTTYNSLAKIKNPVTASGAAFALSGNFVGSTVANQGTNSLYWSSTVNDDTTMSGMLVSTAVTPLSNSDRTNGNPIRCTLKFTVNNLQDFGELTAKQRLGVANAMPLGVNITLPDIRDGQTYTIARLKDENVWMTQNMRLGAVTLSTDLLATNSNLIATNGVTAATVNSWKNDTEVSIGSYTDAEFMYEAGDERYNLVPYGVLYNYAAATANTIKGASVSGSASYDICPAGFKMPSGNTSGELYKLYQKYHSYDEMHDPVASGGAAFSLDGSFDTGGGISYRNRRARYWSLTRNSSVKVYGLNVDQIDSSIDGTPTYDRNRGYSLRCLLKTT